MLRDYFTPADEATMNAKDLDLGSGGPMMLPDQPGSHPHIVLIGGKSGSLFGSGSRSSGAPAERVD